VNKSRERGYDEFFKGADLNANPYERDTQEAQEWDNGNWEAYDDYKKEREENGR